MPEIKVNIDHRIGQSEAIRRLQEYAVRASNNYGKQVSDIKLEWRNEKSLFSFKAAGMAKVSGQVIVRNNAVEIVINLPLLFFGFKNMVIEKVKQEGQNLLR